MANYVFEQMTQAQANAFVGNTDFLVFTSSTTTASSLSVVPTLSGDAIVLTAGTQSLTFSTTQLANATAIQHVVFNDNSLLLTGTPNGAGDNLAGTASNDVVYGFAGTDTLTGNAGNDYLYGGADADTINGNDGADHIYGNSITSQQGAADGADLLSGGLGGDYINGNAGNDTITGNEGSDRLFGGNGNDTINGNDDNDTINGNLGDDSIMGDAGNDFIRGGQGADTLLGGANDDIVVGDLGNDSLVGGAGFDALTGGDGVDTFSFALGDAAVVTTGATAYNLDLITDFVKGTDVIDLIVAATPTGNGDLLFQSADATFGTVAQAYIQAQQLLDNHAGTTDIAVMRVGSDTYLFFNDAGAAPINSGIRLGGLSITGTAGLAASDFV